MAGKSGSAQPKRWKKITRRAFLVTGVTVVGGAAIGVGWLSRAGTGMPDDFANGGPDGSVALNAWIRIEPDGTIAVAVPRAEMGQGVTTALPMLVAEELEVGLDRITVEHPDMHGVYTNYALMLESAGLLDAEGNPLRWVVSKIAASIPYVGTGGSTSVIDAWMPLRQAGAAARQMLIAAAAEQWDVDAASCRVAEGDVVHPDGSTRLSYAALAARAGEIAPPSEPAVKPASAFKLIGTSQPRLDIPAKVTGQADFGVDVRSDGMLYAAIKHCPVKGGRIVNYDAAAVRGMKGVVGVVEVDGGVAVVADNSWRAFKAAEALPVQVEAPDAAATSSPALAERLRAQLAQEPTHVFEDVGDVAAGFAEAAGWGRSMPAGRGLGIALHESFGSIVAQVAEVAVVDGELAVEKVWCAVDCGVVVNPDTVQAQMESGIIFGLSAALYGEITLDQGRIEQENFPDYEMVTLATVPRIETVMVPSGGRPGGVGEVALPPIAPAVANALFAASGKRLRELPLRLEG